MGDTAKFFFRSTDNEELRMPLKADNASFPGGVDRESHG